jgi:hypothetical protein
MFVISPSQYHQQLKQLQEHLEFAATNLEEMRLETVAAGQDVQEILRVRQEHEEFYPRHLGQRLDLLLQWCSGRQYHLQKHLAQIEAIGRLLRGQS